MRTSFTQACYGWVGVRVSCACIISQTRYPIMQYMFIMVMVACVLSSLFVALCLALLYLLVFYLFQTKVGLHEEMLSEHC